MKRYIHANSDLVNDVTMELEAILEAEGNGAEVVGLSSHNTYYLWVQETGPGYAIYFDDGSVWRDRSKDRNPIYFDSLQSVAQWLTNN